MYGNPESVPVDESQAIRPESVYAETKAIVERVLHWYSEVRGVRSVSLRYFNAAGASFDARIGEDWTYALNLVPVAMKAVLLGDTRLQVFGDDYPTPDGTCIRDYVHGVGRVWIEVAEWVERRGSDWPFAFDAVCESLGLVPDAVRAGVKRLRVQPTPGPRRRMRPNTKGRPVRL